MKKVFCKNCKYSNMFIFDQNTCKTTNEYNGIEEYKGSLKSVRNDDGECVYYKRKWWKFWIK